MCVCDLDMDYRIFSECIWSFCMRIHMRVLGLQSLLTVFCIIGTEFCCQRNLREGAKPSMWRCLMHAWSCLTSAFREWELLVCAADSLEWCTCYACKTSSPFLFQFSSVLCSLVWLSPVEMVEWNTWPICWEVISLTWGLSTFAIFEKGSNCLLSEIFSDR